MTIVKGIKLSVAALLVENAFRDILHFNNEQIKNLNGDTKFERFCDKESLEEFLEHIRTDGNRGLPSLSPPRRILAEVIDKIGLKSTIAALIILVSDNAFYEKP